MQVLCNYLKMLIRALWDICHRGGKKGCHGNDNANGATAMFRFPVTRLRYRCKREVCGCVEHARDGGVLPVTGFPRFDDGVNKGTTNVHGRIQHPNMHLIQHVTCIRSTGIVPAVIPSKNAITERNEFVVEVVEVDVLAM